MRHGSLDSTPGARLTKEPRRAQRLCGARSRKVNVTIPPSPIGGRFSPLGIVSIVRDRPRPDGIAAREPLRNPGTIRYHPTILTKPIQETSFCPNNEVKHANCPSARRRWTPRVGPSYPAVCLPEIRPLTPLRRRPTVILPRQGSSSYKPEAPASEWLVPAGMHALARRASGGIHSLALRAGRSVVPPG